MLGFLKSVFSKPVSNKAAQPGNHGYPVPPVQKAGPSASASKSALAAKSASGTPRPPAPAPKAASRPAPPAPKAAGPVAKNVAPQKSPSPIPAKTSKESNTEESGFMTKVMSVFKSSAPKPAENQIRV